MDQKIKSKAFKRANDNVKGRLKDFFLKSYNHYTVPGINLIRNNKYQTWNISSMIGMFQDYPYYCDLPKPLLPPVKLSRQGKISTAKLKSTTFINENIFNVIFN